MGACAIPGAPCPSPPDFPTAKSLLACQGSTGAEGERDTGGFDQTEPPPGLERAPPRLIPGEDDRRFPQLAVASPFIPEGGV